MLCPPRCSTFFRNYPKKTVQVFLGPLWLQISNRGVEAIIARFQLQAILKTPSDIESASPIHLKAHEPICVMH